MAKTNYPRRRLQVFVLAITCAVAFWPRLTHASDLEEQVRTKYQNQVLTLRRFYEGNKLHFDSSGHLVGKAAIGPWTLDGQIDVTEVHLLGQTLQLKGKRLRLVADPSSHNLRDALAVAAGDPLSKEFRQFGGKNWQKFAKSAQIDFGLELALVPQHASEVTSAMNAVFLSSGEELADIVPEFWKGFVLKQEGRPPTNELASGPYELGKRMGVSPPRAVSAPDPKYSEVARQIGFEGTTVLSLIVTPEGTARDIKVVKPLGLGLDEEAVKAVSTWRFAPARKDGNPVAVPINVEVTFRLY